MVLTLQCVASNIDVVEMTHIAGKDNDKCDRLSRRGATPAASVENEVREMGVEGGGSI